MCGLGGIFNARLKASSRLLSSLESAMAEYPTIEKLPVNYCRAIGRLVSRFAFLESLLRHLIYRLLGVDRKAGRIAVRNPRVRDSFIMITDLMSLQSFTAATDIKMLAKECEKIEKFCDKVSHGVWVKHAKSGDPILQVTAGSFTEKQGGPSIKARIRPQALEITMEDFGNLNAVPESPLNRSRLLRLNWRLKTPHRGKNCRHDYIYTGCL